jgi:hypothetical protein
MYVRSMGKRCVNENIYLGILTDFHVFSTPEYQEAVFSLCVCIYACFVPERLDEFYPYSAFKNLSITQVGRCPQNMNILAPKIGGFTRTPKSKIAIFSSAACNSLWRRSPCKIGVFRKITILPLVTQTRMSVFLRAA